MQVQWTQKGNRLVFSFELTGADTPGPFQNKVGAQRWHKLNKSSFFVELPNGVNVSDIHPDLIGLSTIVLLDVFVAKEIKLQSAVSSSFHEAYLACTGKQILPVDPDLQPRLVPSNPVPALAFSGGVDSVAALELMPKNTVLVFSDRIQKEAQKYNKAAAHQACESLQRLGKTVYMVENDIEYMISPNTYTHALAPGVPATLLADFLKLDSVSFGNVLETVYGVAHNRYKKDTSLVMGLDKVFSAVQLQASHVTAGLSEVATTKIVLGSRYKDLAQSCMYGDSLGQPCKKCIKCFRKITLESILKQRPVDGKFLDTLFTEAKEVAGVFQTIPVVLQNVYMYIAEHLSTRHEAIRLLRRKTGAKRINTAWMEGWFYPSANLLPDKHQTEIVSNINKHLKPMSFLQALRVKSWNLQLSQYSPLRLFWHWRFWEVFSRNYDYHLLELSIDRLRLKAGEKKKIFVYKKRPFWQKEDISDHVQWGSSNSTAAYCKGGVVRGKSGGSAQIHASYGKSRVAVEVTVDR